MKYVDGFVLPVPAKNLADYRRIAAAAGKVWREYGALEYYECVGDDVKPGKLTSFPQSVKLKRGETVVFSWILYKSRAHRDRVNARMMQMMKESSQPMDMPFAMKRMTYGGFKVIVSS